MIKCVKVIMCSGVCVFMCSGVYVLMIENMIDYLNKTIPVIILFKNVTNQCVKN